MIRYFFASPKSSLLTRSRNTPLTTRGALKFAFDENERLQVVGVQFAIGEDWRLQVVGEELQVVGAIQSKRFALCLDEQVDLLGFELIRIL
jgi:hypothetical protein